jgi:hypothetical protein
MNNLTFDELRTLATAAMNSVGEGCVDDDEICALVDKAEKLADELEASAFSFGVGTELEEFVGSPRYINE